MGTSRFCSPRQQGLGPGIDTTHFNQQEPPSNTLFVFLERVTQETLISFHTIIHHNQKEHDASKTYVVLKVQNLKSTTIDRQGSEPCWEQDFMFEICADGKGFVVELWKKGLLWDSILGVLWIPLATVEYATDLKPLGKNPIDIQPDGILTSYVFLCLSLEEETD
ncbi:hypothetical protein BTVI_61431 [Pitangus sulphuratus]|nr:hypothetical protein BTVI_61431 [Pitangus sulphuratus]